MCLACIYLHPCNSQNPVPPSPQPSCEAFTWPVVDVLAACVRRSGKERHVMKGVTHIYAGKRGHYSSELPRINNGCLHPFQQATPY